MRKNIKKIQDVIKHKENTEIFDIHLGIAYPVIRNTKKKTEKMGGQRAYKELRQEVFVQLTFPGSTRHWTSKTATLIVISSSKCPKYRTAF